MRQLYDVKAAAKLLAVSHWTIRALIRQGKMNPIRLGRLVRLDANEIERFIDEAKTESGVVQTLNERGADQ